MDRENRTNKAVINILQVNSHILVSFLNVLTSSCLCSFGITTFARARKTFLSTATRACCWPALSNILDAKCWIRWNTLLNGAASC